MANQARLPFFFLIFLAPLFILCALGIREIHIFENALDQSPKGIAVIKEYRKMSFLKGRYLAEIKDVDGNTVRKNIITSRDYSRPLKIGNTVGIAYLDDHIEVIDHLSPLLFNFIKIFLGLLMLSLILLFIPKSININRYIGGSIFIALGLFGTSAASFYYIQQDVFFDHSGITDGTIIGHKSKICKDSEDGGYTCYARIIEYIVDEQPYTYVEKNWRSFKKGKQGEQIPFHYLKTNPSEGQLSSKLFAKTLAAFGILAGAFVVYVAFRVLRKTESKNIIK